MSIAIYFGWEVVYGLYPDNPTRCLHENKFYGLTNNLKIVSQPCQLGL